MGAAKQAKDPNAVLTPDEQAGIQYITGKNQIERNTPEKQNTALVKLDGQAKDFLKMGDTQMSSFNQVEVKKRQDIYLRSMELGKAAIANNRTIDPASIIRQAKEEVDRANILSPTGATAGTPKKLW